MTSLTDLLEFHAPEPSSPTVAFLRVARSRPKTDALRARLAVETARRNRALKTLSTGATQS